jgi:hypothetical protein
MKKDPHAQDRILAVFLYRSQVLRQYLEPDSIIDQVSDAALRIERVRAEALWLDAHATLEKHIDKL